MTNRGAAHLKVGTPSTVHVRDLFLVGDIGGMPYTPSSEYKGNVQNHIKYEEIQKDIE